jgi:hypothetical protein
MARNVVLAREGVLTPGYRGRRQWTRNSETVASIRMRTEPGLTD